MSLEEDSIPFQIQVRLKRLDESQQRFLALWFSRNLKLNDIWLKIGRKLLTNHARQDQLTLPSNAALFNLGSSLWLFEGSGIIRFRIPHGSRDPWIWASSQSSCRANGHSHIQNHETVWLTFQSGIIWPTCFQIACRTSTQVYPAEQRISGSFRILLSTVLEGFVEPRHRSFMKSASAELQLSFIYNIYI